jgi:exopolyphosphatase/guanosine-5'-triphosphate,3'-diphosphate pyrophosphatase
VTDAPKLVAAVDLGSNSFHMVVAQLDTDRRLTVVDRIKERVRLAGGLAVNKEITANAQRRALECLERFGERLREFPPGTVRAVGTDTFRRASNGEALLAQARAALGHPIEIVSGLEEARLVYRGVSHDHGEPGPRLVVDIGGGSTEAIVGQDQHITLAHSMHMGCVSWSLRHFTGGRIDAASFDAAVRAASIPLGRVASGFRALEWDHALGSSGTCKAIERILVLNDLNPEGITLDGLRILRRTLLAAGHTEALQLEGLSHERAQVLPGGVAILTAVFQELGLTRMTAVQAALREGLLLDLVGRLFDQDLRETTVQHYMDRLHVDEDQAGRVADTALHLFDQVRAAWGMGDSDRAMLRWAARLHEVGMFLSFSGYQRHGAYVLRNAELAGFSLQGRTDLATLVEQQRGKLDLAQVNTLSQQNPRLLRQVRLLRLAVRLHRRRSTQPLPRIKAKAKGETLILRFPHEWLTHRALTRVDLMTEVKRQGAAGLRLVVL